MIRFSKEQAEKAGCVSLRNTTLETNSKNNLIRTKSHVIQWHYLVLSMKRTWVQTSNPPLGLVEVIGHLAGGLRPPLIKRPPNSNNILYNII